MNVAGSRSERLEVVYEPFLPFVVQVLHHSEWVFHLAFATYLEAHHAADVAAKHWEKVRVVKRAESNVKS